MRIVAISSLGANHRYVLESIQARRPLERVIQPVAPSGVKAGVRSSRWSRWGRHPLRTMLDRCRLCYQDWRMARLETALHTELLSPELSAGTGESKSSESAWPGPLQRIPRDALHAPETLAAIRELQPDVILTSGCPLLKPELYRLPRWGTLNIHWGISPAYRGEHTLFWSLYHNDPPGMGITIHRIDDSIDGGPLLAQGWPELTLPEDEVSLTVKSARLAALLLNDVLDTLEQLAQQGHIWPGEAPSQPGRLFPRRARGWRQDIALQVKQFKQPRTQPSRPAKIWFAPLPIESSDDG